MSVLIQLTRRSAAFGLVALCVVMCATRSDAQTIAVTGGLTSTNILEDPHVAGDVQQRAAGPMAGVSFELSLRNPIALHVDALFVRKGNRLVNEPAAIDSALTVDYFEVPVLAAIRVLSRLDMTLRVQAGPTIGIKMRRQETGFGNALPDDQQIRLKDTDFGIAVGVQLDHQQFAIGVRYTRGVSNIFADDPALYGVDRLTNRAFAAYGGWIFHHDDRKTRRAARER